MTANNTIITPSTPVTKISFDPRTGNRVVLVGDVKVECNTVYHSNNYSGRTVRTNIVADLDNEQQVVAAAKALGLIRGELPVKEWNTSDPDTYFSGYYVVRKESEGWSVETHMPSCE